MNNYPPYKINSNIVNYISSITEAITKLEINEKNIITPLLRKKNRVKTLAGTLEIEGNYLGEEKITAIINGKRVLGTTSEISEVEGAINAYKELGNYKFDNIQDLLKAHEILMTGILKTAGNFRNVNVGVGKHIAPPANRVNELMTNLFEWLANSDEHPLIKSSVFHYEFEFIHPFSDGNGRIGRLWQTVILHNWKSIFAVIPTESLVRDNQAEYYKAIEKSTSIGESTPFIEFMMKIISNSVAMVNDPVNIPVNVPVNRIDLILELIKKNKDITIIQLAGQVKVSDKTIKRDISKLKKENIIQRIGSDKTGYWKILRNYII